MYIPMKEVVTCNECWRDGRLNKCPNIQVVHVAGKPIITRMFHLDFCSLGEKEEKEYKDEGRYDD